MPWVLAHSEKEGEELEAIAETTRVARTCTGENEAKTWGREEARGAVFKLCVSV